MRDYFEQVFFVCFLGFTSSLLKYKIFKLGARIFPKKVLFPEIFFFLKYKEFFFFFWGGGGGFFPKCKINFLLRKYKKFFNLVVRKIHFWKYKNSLKHFDLDENEVYFLGDFNVNLLLNDKFILRENQSLDFRNLGSPLLSKYKELCQTFS